MSKAELDFTRLWTEAEYLALGDMAKRIELIDGRLRVAPDAKWEHSDIGSRLWVALEPAVTAAKLDHAQTVNVRLAPDRLVIPDIAVAHRRGSTITDAAGLVLVGEITSPSNASYDRDGKMRLYAEARIGWYMLVEPDMSDYRSVALRLLRLDGDRYLEYAEAAYGETLVAEQPFPFEIRTKDLIKP